MPDNMIPTILRQSDWGPELVFPTLRDPDSPSQMSEPNISVDWFEQRLQVLCYEVGEDDVTVKVRLSPQGKIVEVVVADHVRVLKASEEDINGWYDNPTMQFPLPELQVDSIELPDDCAMGLHSWTDTPGRLAPDTTCEDCGERYGNPS